MKLQFQNLVSVFRSEIAIYRAVMADPRCPRLARWMLGGAAVYALSPVDLIPDFIPVIGHLDDAIILPIMIWVAIRIIPKELIAQHRAVAENDRVERIATCRPCQANEGAPDVRDE